MLRKIICFIYILTATLQNLYPQQAECTSSHGQIFTKITHIFRLCTGRKVLKLKCDKFNLYTIQNAPWEVGGA